MSLYFRGQRVCPITGSGGGPSGHTVYFINRVSNDDYGIITLNDDEEFTPVNEQGGSGTTSTNCIMSNVESISLRGFDHWALSVTASSSWACWRPHQDDWQSWIGTGGTFIPSGKTGVTLAVDEDIDFVIHSGTCLTGDMMILMADGSEKPVRDIIAGDMVMTPEGPEKVTWSDSGIVQYGDAVDHWYFEDIEIKTINPHRFWNCERKAFVYLHDWKTGEHTLDAEGNEVMLTGHIRTIDKERHYTIFADGCNAYYVNGLLSGNRFSKVTV